METFKKYLGYLATAVVMIFVGLFLKQNKEKNEALQKVENSEYEKEKAIIKEKIASLTKEQQAAIAVHEIETNRPMSLEELQRFFNEELK